ncbi:MAG: carotenoid biosynthesis protein [Chthonomonas sp.]|nr:carotenoid biosynthesis protein [Chthonomonas sp.]
MVDRSNRTLKWYLGLIAFSIGGLILSRVTGLDPGPIAPLSSLLVIVFGVLAVGRAYGRARYLWPILVIGGLSELVGLYTGYPFGTYTYTDQWWPTIPLGESHRFPLILPFAWAMIVGAAGSLAGGRAWLGGLIAALIDLPMEHAMTEVFGYWKWTPPGPLFGAPVLNFFGWWAVGWLALLATKGAEPKPTPAWVLGGFCLLMALAGILAQPDWAWLVLAVYTVFLASWAARLRRTELE